MVDEVQETSNTKFNTPFSVPFRICLSCKIFLYNCVFMKDIRHLGRHPPVNSSVARALTSFSSSKWAGVTSGSSTPTQSQPSSPMKKEPSPFRFPPEGSNSSKSAFEQPQRDSMPSAFERRDSLFSQKIQRMQQDRIQVTGLLCKISNYILLHLFYLFTVFSLGSAFSLLETVYLLLILHN